METSAQIAVLQAFSRGDISRAELGRRLGRELDFAETLLLLRQHGMTLPRPPRDPQSPGVQLIKALAEAAGRG